MCNYYWPPMRAFVAVVWTPLSWTIAYGQVCTTPATQAGDITQTASAFEALSKDYSAWRDRGGPGAGAASLDAALRDIFRGACLLLEHGERAQLDQDSLVRLRAQARLRLADALRAAGQFQDAQIAYSAVLDTATSPEILLLAEAGLRSLPLADVALQKDEALLREVGQLLRAEKYEEARIAILKLIESSNRIEIIRQARISLDQLPVFNPAHAREAATLKEAGRLKELGQFEKARELYRKVLESTNSRGPSQQATEALKELPSTPTLASRGKAAWQASLGHLETGAAWILDFAAVIVAMLLLWLVLKPVQRLYRARLKVWKLERISSEQTPYMTELLLSAIGDAQLQVAPRAFGHLTVLRDDPMALVRGTTPGEKWDFNDLPLPTIGDVKLSGFLKLCERLGDWLRGPYKRLNGHLTAANDTLTMAMTLWASPDRAVTVIAQGPDTLDGRKKAVAEVGTKMLHLMTRPYATTAEAEGAFGLRDGWVELQRYLTGGGVDTLTAAEWHFRSAVEASGGADESLFYLGITLDLGGKHDEAIQIMHGLATSSRDDQLRKWAAFNEAVMRLRKYEPGELHQAEQILTKMSPPAALKTLQPHDVFVLVKLADVLAHKPLFEQFRESASEILQKVKALTDRAQRAVPKKAARKPGGAWDEDLRLSCLWAIHNARGNIALNIAMKLMDDHLSGITSRAIAGQGASVAAEVRDEDNPAQPPQSAVRLRSGIYEMAVEAFRKAAALEPHGVEPLTNLGTALDQYARHLLRKEAADGELVAKARGMIDEARERYEQCIVSNSKYEYAYYRLAQLYLETCNNQDQAKATVGRCRAAGVEPTIPGFRQLVQRLESNCTT